MQRLWLVMPLLRPPWRLTVLLPALHRLWCWSCSAVLYCHALLRNCLLPRLRLPLLMQKPS